MIRKKNTGKSYLGLFWRPVVWVWWAVIALYRVVTLIVLVGIAAALWFGLQGPPTVPVKQNVALVLRPYGALVDQPSIEIQPWLDQIGGSRANETSLESLRRALRDAADDPRIRIAVLDLDHMTSTSLPKIEELARSVDYFRRSGKAVYVYGDSFNQYQYLLAAHANRIALNPMGGVTIKGLAIYNDYFKDALRKAGVQVNVFRVGPFKSAVEPFTRNNMSPDARLANKALLSILWKNYQSNVTTARHLPKDAIKQYVDGFADGLSQDGGDAASYALNRSLVDAVERRSVFRDAMVRKVGKNDRTGNFRQISAMDYLRDQGDRDTNKPNRIALIVVEGDIVNGQSRYHSAGGDTISALLNRVRHDKAISAVVLRVDSPGGSVSASEKIRRSVQMLKASGKPVVVSMSTLAASGGYWISMDANRIYAEPTTITGSIGIFGLVPTVNKLLNKLGVYSDGLGTTPLAGGFRIDRPLTRSDRKIIQSEIDFGYRQFIDGVSKGRGLPLKTVKEIAGGRVWSGKQAKNLGLVDAFGGLHAATAEAAKLANLPPGSYSLEPFRPRIGLLRLILRRFTSDSKAGTGYLDALAAEGPSWLFPLHRAALVLSRFNDPRGIYAYCFCRPEAGALNQ